MPFLALCSRKGKRLKWLAQGHSQQVTQMRPKNKDSPLNAGARLLPGLTTQRLSFILMFCPEGQLE